MHDNARTPDPGGDTPATSSAHRHAPSPDLRANRVADAVPRRPLAVHGIVTAVTVRDVPGAVLDATLDDGTGLVELSFLGRRSVPGIVPGARVAADGVALVAHGRLTLLNPRYHFIA